ncbi:hypothetical protein L195_g034060 [Trifolium pratense]|uniref:Uncharacterized protein n=2 Tax=Trifolium pratense TaxID=57577 RepID=A0A2K3LHQ9_TRIPR|nr:hypothetical protein L195_g034044 [Trifolium pratense]PNX78085.1 hypothetical protein L195_g034060 [Trifolium pratense]
MDHSLKSSRGKVVPTTTITTTKNNTSCQEESGWTTYFDDFSKGIEPSYCSGGGSSLVSDAASYAAWKFSHRHNHVVASKLPKKLCFNKTRSKIISDDPLEDTASSPVNSPKVRDMNPNEIVSRKIDDQLQAGSMGKGFTSSKNHSELLHMDDMHEFEFNEKNIDSTDLKQRGLCLVPLSLLVNYMG